MSKFCTSCGTSNDGSVFCTGCGAAIGVVSVPVSDGLAQDVPSEKMYELPLDSRVSASGQDSKPARKSKRKIFALVGLVLILAGTGVGTYFLGKNSIDLVNEKKISYNTGYSEGEKTGISAGYDRGLEQGKESGCREVFSFSDGTFDYLIPYDPFNYYNKYPGSYYVRRSNC